MTYIDTRLKTRFKGWIEQMKIEDWVLKYLDGNPVKPLIKN